MNKETRQFISEHEKDDIFTLRLQYNNNQDIDINLAINQITGKQKIKNKVPLFYHNENVLYPAQLSLEQSSSEPTAQYKATLCHGNTLNDLTGGFGVDCCFMSEYFKEVIYVERQTTLCELATHNFKVLGKNHIQVVNAETEEYLPTIKHVDWIYIDPARRSSSGKKMVLLSDCEPDVSALASVLLSKANQIMIKLSPMMDITSVIKELPNTSEIHIISVENECKEVLLILNQSTQNEKKIRTVNFAKKNNNQVFEYNLTEEVNAKVSVTSTVGDYLFEPNASVMKSGAFKLIGTKFELNKLHINTHLYTSNKLPLEFPGRVFKVQECWGSSKKEQRELVEQNPKANISCRNYPLSAEELRKKLKIKDGGDTYLFACTLANDEKLIIKCSKLHS
jgi:16S rRNA G966 N2-methylase RsmD